MFCDNSAFRDLARNRDHLIMGALKSLSLATLVAALPLLPFSAAHADTLFGVYAGAGSWEQETSGTVVSALSSVDVEDDLAIGDDRSTVLYVALEHGVPFLPNVRAQHFGIDLDGSNVLSRTIEFNGQVFSVSDAAVTVVDLSQSDAVFYYEALDNVVSLDMGLSVSMVDGSIAVTSLTEATEAEFEEVIPMLYARARADLPFTGLWVGAEAQGISYGDSTLLEYNAQIGWESDFGLGFEAGYRAVELEIEAFDEVDNADIEVRGPYAAINYHF